MVKNSNKSSEHYVYLHYAKGDSSPFYVGASSNKKRPFVFTQRSKEWASMFEAAEQQIDVKVFTVANKQEAKILENDYIRQYHDSLCNKTKSSSFGGASEPISPKVAVVLRVVGRNIKLARMRRGITAAEMAAKAGISRRTLTNLELGNPPMSLVSYLNVLFVLGMEGELLTVGAADPIGRLSQDNSLLRGRVNFIKEK